MIITKPVVVGMGRVGSLVALMLEELGMHVVGVDQAKGPMVPESIQFEQANVTDGKRLRAICQGRDALISCLPYHLVVGAARIAHKAGLHYFDLTEDVETTESIRSMAQTAQAVMIPQNGLAPGFIGMGGAYLARQVDPGTLRWIKLRVGALPQNPIGQLGYASNWSLEGLVNAYMADCDVIVNGRRRKVPALSSPEILRIHGIEYEAFATSGGLGTMTETYEGSVETLDYKTIRYPGHLAAMRLLLEDLRYRDHPDELVKRLAYALPPDDQDRVLIHASVQGRISGRWQTKELALDYKPIVYSGAFRTAIAWTTAASLVSVVELVSSGALPQRGFAKQEEIPLEHFLRTTTGKLFAANHPAWRELSIG